MPLKRQHNRYVAKKRGRENAYDMVLSLSAVFAAVVIILVITWRPQEQVVMPVDYAGAKQQAVAGSNWPIYVPSEIPSGYQVTAARFEAESYGDSGDSRWYLGLTSADEQFISLWQSDGKPGQIKAAATNSAECSETQIINGQEWEKCFTEKPETRAFVRTDRELIYIVSGNAEYSALEKFIESLEIAK